PPPSTVKLAPAGVAILNLATRPSHPQNSEGADQTVAARGCQLPGRPVFRQESATERPITGWPCSAPLNPYSSTFAWNPAEFPGRRGDMNATRLVIAVAAALVWTLGPAAAADGTFGLPADTARQARKQCNLMFPTSSNLQAACMRNEKQSFDQLTPLAPFYENSKVAYDSASEAYKARLRAKSGPRDANAIQLCPPPYRMTERDGCQ